MIAEHTYDTKKICYGCEHLRLDSSSYWSGVCECTENRVKNRNRHVTDRKCAFKRMDGR